MSQDIAIEIPIKEFLALINEQIAKLEREVDAIYPILGKQTYRMQDLKAWAVEQYIIDIRNKDLEISQLRNLHDQVLSEARNLKASGQ